MRFWCWMWLLIMTGFLGACASQIPNEIRHVPPEMPSESAVREQPQHYLGARVRWGGTVVSVENRPSESVIEIISRPLESNGRPQDEQPGLGRFLARFSGFLDPAVITAGQPITVLGTVEGTEEHAIGKYQYQFPVIKIESYYLWPPKPVQAYPPPYWYDPWWYDPWWPYPHYPRPYR